MPITVNNIPASLKRYIAEGVDRFKGHHVASMLREGEVCLYEKPDNAGHYVVAFRDKGQIQRIDNPPMALETYFKPPRVPVEGTQLSTRTTDWFGHYRDEATGFVATYKLQGNELFSVEALKKQLRSGEFFLRASVSDPRNNVAVFNNSNTISEVKLDEHSITIGTNPKPLSEIIKSGYSAVTPYELSMRELSKYVANGKSDQSLKDLAGKLRENEFFLHDNGTKGQQKFLCIRLNGRINEMPVDHQQLQEHFKKNKPIEVTALQSRKIEIVYDTSLQLPKDISVDRYSITATPTHTIDQLKRQLKTGECCLRDSNNSPGQKVLIVCISSDKLSEIKLSADQKTTQAGAPIDLKDYLSSKEWQPVDTATLNQRADNQANNTAQASQGPTLQRTQGSTTGNFQKRVLQLREELHDKNSDDSYAPPISPGKQ